MPYLTGNPCLRTRDGSDKRRDELAVDVGAVEELALFVRVVVGVAELALVVRVPVEARLFAVF